MNLGYLSYRLSLPQVVLNLKLISLVHHLFEVASLHLKAHLIRHALLRHVSLLLLLYKLVNPMFAL